MNPDQPEPDEQLDPLSPAEEERIRALLADARATEPMPAAVVARLDRSLAGLAAERNAIDPVPADNVVPIARTRRHRVVAVLGAAAAVVVLGLGVGTFFDQAADDGDDAASTTADTDFKRGSADDGDDNAIAPEEANEREESEADHPNRSGGGVVVADRAFVVRSGHLSRDLTRIREQVLPDADAEVYSQFLVHAPTGFKCKTAAWGEGVAVAVRYDGDPAFVAYRDPIGDVQVVDVLQCGTAELLRSTTLPTAG